MFGECWFSWELCHILQYLLFIYHYIHQLYQFSFFDILKFHIVFYFAHFGLIQLKCIFYFIGYFKFLVDLIELEMDHTSFFL